jgi:hypothetical protein
MNDKTQYTISRFINKVYGTIGQKRTAPEAIANCLAKLECEMNNTAKHVQDLNGIEYPTTGTHNVCIRVAISDNGFTTETFIAGATELETAKIAADSGVKSLCRQIGGLKRGLVIIYYLILGTYDFDSRTFIRNTAPDAEEIACVEVNISKDGTAFKLA